MLRRLANEASLRRDCSTSGRGRQGTRYLDQRPYLHSNTCQPFETTDQAADKKSQKTMHWDAKRPRQNMASDRPNATPRRGCAYLFWPIDRT
jgi:hypothetical protein